MKPQLQRISYVVALIAALSACDKNSDTGTSTSYPPPPPPPPPADTLPTTTCSDSNRARVSAQLVPVGKLSQAREGMAVVATGRKILFAGGALADGSVSSRVDIYDVATNAWTQNELSEPLSGMSTVAAGNKVFFAGGRVRIPNTQSFRYYDSVEIYNTETHAWAREKLSESRSHMAGAAVGNKVLFAGGRKADYVPFPFAVDVYDLSSGRWSTAKLSEPRFSLSAVTLGDKVYFAGGNKATGVLGIPLGFAPSNSIDIYDYATNTWTKGHLKESMGAITGIAVSDHIYWAAGCTAEIEDVGTGSSKVVPLSKPGAWIEAAGQHAVVKDNKIVLFRFFGEGQTNTFDIYDIATDTWYIGEVPVSITGASIISVNNTIYLAGGNVNGVVTDKVWQLTF